MATSALSAPPSAGATAPHHSEGLGVSRYEQVSGTLLTVLLVMGVLTLMMFFIWLSSRLRYVSVPVPVMVLEDVGGGGRGETFGARGAADFEEPAPEEVHESAPQPIEESLVALTAVSSIVTTQAFELDAMEGGSSSWGHGEGTGSGDGRGPGPGGPGTSDGIPAYERWEVRMSTKSINEYAQQLDFFGVELAVAGGGNPNVEYVSKVSAPKPLVRIGNPKDERRLRFMHRSGELRQADRELVKRAGLSADGRVVFQFYSPQMYTNLLTLENIRKGNRRIKEVRKTIFGVRGTPGKYEFYVIDQLYM